MKIYYAGCESKNDFNGVVNVKVPALISYIIVGQGINMQRLIECNQVKK